MGCIEFYVEEVMEREEEKSERREREKREKRERERETFWLSALTSSVATQKVTELNWKTKVISQFQTETSLRDVWEGGEGEKSEWQSLYVCVCVLEGEREKTYILNEVDDIGTQMLCFRRTPRLCRNGRIGDENGKRKQKRECQFTWVGVSKWVWMSIYVRIRERVLTWLYNSKGVMHRKTSNSKRVNCRANSIGWISKNDCGWDEIDQERERKERRERIEMREERRERRERRGERKRDQGVRR